MESGTERPCSPCRNRAAVDGHAAEEMLPILRTVMLVCRTIIFRRQVARMQSQAWGRRGMPDAPRCCHGACTRSLTLLNCTVACPKSGCQKRHVRSIRRPWFCAVDWHPDSQSDSSKRSSPNSRPSRRTRTDCIAAGTPYRMLRGSAGLLGARRDCLLHHQQRHQSAAGIGGPLRHSGTLPLCKMPMIA